MSLLCEHVSASLLRRICRSWRRAVDTNTTVLAPAVFHTDLIARRFPALAHLDLSGCAVTVSDDKLKNLQACSNLQTLNLKGCDRLTASGVKPLSQQSSLQTLLLGGELYSIPRQAFREHRDADDKVSPRRSFARHGYVQTCACSACSPSTSVLFTHCLNARTSDTCLFASRVSATK